jgi:hypothetical protein
MQSRWRSAGLRAAAAVLLVAGLSLVWRANRPTGSTTPDGRIASAAQIYRTRTGQIDTVKLGDGSTVVLGPASRLAIESGFGGSARDVDFEGQGISTSCTTTPVRSSCGRRVPRCGTLARRSPSTAIRSAARASR